MNLTDLLLAHALRWYPQKADAVIAMQLHQIAHLPILDRDRQLVGIVSMSDITARLEECGAAAALAEVSASEIENAQAESRADRE